MIYQIGALDGFARVAGTRVRYVKPHGALYNRTVHDEHQAAAVVEAVRRVRPVASGAGAAGVGAARATPSKPGLRTVTEAFADRGYTAAGHAGAAVAARCAAA